MPAPRLSQVASKGRPPALSQPSQTALTFISYPLSNPNGRVPLASTSINE
jgi:hypothetical protein